MATDNTEKWTVIAMDLGYYDQAHFIRDFKSIVGLSPAEYMQRLSNKY